MDTTQNQGCLGQLSVLFTKVKGLGMFSIDFPNSHGALNATYHSSTSIIDELRMALPEELDQLIGLSLCGLD